VKKLRIQPWQLLLLPALLAAGCELPGKPKRPEPGVHFDTLYATHCAGCHGTDGRLGPAPPLNDPNFLALVSDEDRSMVISDGRSVTPGQKSPMPAFARDKGGPLTDAEIDVLANGIKTRWGPPASLPTDFSEVGTSANKDRGERVFARACAGCHGSNGRGGKHGTINDSAFLALISDQALRRYVITGRPDLGMPAYDGKGGRPADFQPLTATEIDDLVALMADWRRGKSAHDKGGIER